MPKCRIGCSGFLYDSWRGTFYPDNLNPRKWLSYYVERLGSVELNVTFYRLLKKEAFERWYNETPPSFCFSLKGSRLITHIKKLKDVELPLLTFFNTTSPLMDKLEVVLWQLPPNFRANIKSLTEFIRLLEPYPVRHVFEFRHKSWITKKIFKLLSESNIGVCMADWPEFIDELPITADFVYIRRHGEVGHYATDYTTEQLKKDANRIKNYLKEEKDVYVYFNNDANGYAPKNAIELTKILRKSLPKNLKGALIISEETEKRKAKPKKVKPKKKIDRKKPKPARKTTAKIKKKPEKKKTLKKLRPKTKKVSKRPQRKPFKKAKKKSIKRVRGKK